MNQEKRKGARSVSEISAATREQLNNGTIETANLVEWLAVDQLLLLKHVLAQQHQAQYYPAVLEQIAGLKKQTVNTVNEAIGTSLLWQAQNEKEDLLAWMAGHTADLVRCWAGYMVGYDSRLGIREKLDRIRPFAADPHFGVREIAWLAVRREIIRHLPESIAVLTTWTSSGNANIRRFASEATRPRGVWCEHITELKKDPALALPILEPLQSDPSKYVRDSVGNWLNDASKTQPAFVKTLATRWNAVSPTKETDYILRKALRTINKSQ